MAAASNFTNRDSNQTSQLGKKESFEVVFGEYIAGLQGSVGESTRANYFHLVTLYCKDTIFSKSIADISHKEIHELLTKVSLAPLNLRPGTVNTLRSRLSAVFNYAVATGRCEMNPVRLVKPHKPKKAGDSQVSEPWTPSEVADAIRAFAGTELELFLDFSLFLGLRKGETLGLTWADVDFSRAIVKITKSHSQRRKLVDGFVVATETTGLAKTSSSIRTLPLPSSLKEKLQALAIVEHPSPQAPIISRNGLHWPISRLGKEFKAICKTHSLRPIRIHDLRHTSAVLGLLGNAPLEAVSQSLGHSGVEITKRFYAQQVSTFPKIFVDGVERALSEKSEQILGTR
jgi:integrase